MLKTTLSLLLLVTFLFDYSTSYSALEDARIIAEYKRQQSIDHAKVARTLVHQVNWASVGTISTNDKVQGYPMVNIISIDDNSSAGKSTGRIRFMLTDLDFTGPDWRHSNKVTFLFTDDQNENCKRRGEDPMEPTCARSMISGKVVQMDKKSAGYADALAAFSKRHPASINWLKAHSFYLCELQIENIFVLDYYGGPHDVPIDVYYNTDPEETKNSL